MTLTDADLDRLEAVGPKDGFATILWQDVHALIAEVRRLRAEGAWRPIGEAPRRWRSSTSAGTRVPTR